MKQFQGVEVVGHGDDLGGCQWALFANECRGAKVVLTGGFDYGSWVEWAGEVDETTYKQLQQWDTLDYDKQAALRKHITGE